MFGGLRRLHKYRRFPFLPFLLSGNPTEQIMSDHKVIKENSIADGSKAIEG
jgi:hypothetical protein